MNKARSIKQNTLPDALPNFRNLGVILRILLLSNGLALLQAALQVNAWGEVPFKLMQIAALLTPVLLTNLLLLWVLQPVLARRSYLEGVSVVLGLVVFITFATYHLGGELYQPIEREDRYFDVVRYVLLSVIVSGILLMYFRLRMRVLSRAWEDAHLQVLRARIRPHFMFNSINAVLSILREQPKRAETALEDMSDLFRMAMADAHDLVSVRQELQLCKQYLALESLRMGERLTVEWHTENLPEDALIPPLLLQPLLENAVYHGIEPLPQGGTIRIELRRQGEELTITVENPCAPRPTNTTHVGNKMALQNIQQRLELLFDVEARYKVDSSNALYRVQITLPYMKESL